MHHHVHGQKTFSVADPFGCYYGTEGKTLTAFGTVLNCNGVNGGIPSDDVSARDLTLATVRNGNLSGGRSRIFGP